jgi:hypothetical protein
MLEMEASFTESAYVSMRQHASYIESVKKARNGIRQHASYIESV